IAATLAAVAIVLWAQGVRERERDATDRAAIEGKARQELEHREEQIRDLADQLSRAADPDTVAKLRDELRAAMRPAAEPDPQPQPPPTSQPTAAPAPAPTHRDGSADLPPTSAATPQPVLPAPAPSVSGRRPKQQAWN